MKRTVKDVDLKGKRVLMRVDFNVPLDKAGNLSDDTRIKESLATIKYILQKGAEKLILMSHLGRPEGKVVENLRLGSVAKKLAQLLGEEVAKLDDCIGEKVKKEISSRAERVVLLENLRFYPQEEKGEEKFARELAALADIYVNDAFGTAHRAHASTAIVAKFLPSCLGFLMEKELRFLSSALNPQKPYAVILGGAKVSDKIEIITSLMKKADKFLIGGAMAYTFLKSRKEEVGNSRVEMDKLDLAKNILALAAEKGIKIFLPVDHLVVDNLDNPTVKKTVKTISAGLLGVDIGPLTIELFKKELSTAKTILWNGPLGIFEKDNYSRGTQEIAQYLPTLTQATIIVGGGDSAAAAKKFKVAEELAHVSTGGGASLEFLEGKELPGIAALSDK